MKLQTFYNNLPAKLVQLASYMLIAICLAVVLVFVMLAQYSHPSSDDFCMASGVNDFGLIRHLWDHYFEWSGRYTSNTLYAIYPVIFGLFDGYKFIPAVVLLMFFIATAFFLSRLFNVSVVARPVLLSSLCFISVYLLGMMSPASSLYWMAGALTYQSANILFFVVLGLMLQLADRQKSAKNSFNSFAVLLLVLVFAIGTNETSMLALTGLALLGVVLHLRSGRAILKPWLVILVVALVCFSVVYYSPGNVIRAADFPLRHDLSRSLNGSLSVGFKILWLWLSNPVLIVSSFLAPFAISSLTLLSARSFAVSKRMVVILVLATLAMPVLLQFPAWWSMGGWPPARTQDAIYFLFLVGWYLSIGAFTIHYLCKGKRSQVRSTYSPGSAVILVLLAGLFTAAALESHAYQLAKADLFHLARPYDEYLNMRYKIIEQAEADGQRYLAVPDYQLELPRTIFFNDIMFKPNHWRNVCYADYFGLEKIKRKKRARGRRFPGS
ncbi:MAG: DUF6056 family protein [Gammaproteobacteria bacterium]